MAEKIIYSFIALTILAFFLGMGASGFLGKSESGKRALPLPIGIVMFGFTAIFYLYIVLTVLIPILRR